MAPEDAIDKTPRPSAPPELTDEETIIWDSITARMPAQWFGPETFPLLIQYSRHAACCNRLAVLIQSIERGRDIDLKAYNELLRMQDRETRAITMLATKMRLAQQSTIDREAKVARVGAKKPWEE